MQIIETRVHTGPDGVLRIETPTGEPDADLRVLIYVCREVAGSAAVASGGPGQALRDRLTACGADRTIRVPAPGSWNREPVEPLKIDGDRSASQRLVDDRR